jgi:hypothetical protein
MPSIIISSDSAPISRKIAQDVAGELGYSYLGSEFLDEVAERYGARELDLARALQARGARLGILNRTRETNLCYIQAAVLERFCVPGIVCDGLGAHLYLREIPHVMNVRVLEDLKRQTNRLAAEEGVSPGRIRRRLERRADRRRRWSVEVFGVDESNPANYDMVISLGQIESDRVVKTICSTIGDRRFTEMTYSKKRVADRVLECRIRATLIKSHPAVKIAARDGTVTLGLARRGPGWRKRAEKVKHLVEDVDGVKYVEVHRSLPTHVGNGVIDEN